MSSAVAVDDLHKSSNELQALRGVSFEIAQGEIFGLLGPNGAGKTTTVEILEGYRDRDGGTVAVLGEDPATAGLHWRERIGVVLQSSAFYDSLTVAENLALFAGYYSQPRPIGDVVELVGLEEKRDALVRSLSGGNAAASTSGSRSSAIRKSSSSTNRPRASTPKRGGAPGRQSRRCATSARRSCSRRTTSRKPSGSRTGSPSCETASSLRSARRRS